MSNEENTMIPDNAEVDAQDTASEAPRETVSRAEADEWKDKYLRKLAEFDNFRKRTRVEMESLREAAVESVIAGLLPALDDFDRMLGGMAETNDPYRKAVELICSKVWSQIRAYGVERIESLGKPFDPAEHEALSVQPTADFPAGTVLTVVAPGYRMKHRVIRHAQVIVSGESEPGGPVGSSSESALIPSKE